MLDGVGAQHQHPLTGPQPARTEARGDRSRGDATPFRAAAERLGIPLTVLELDEPVVTEEPLGLVLVRPDLFVGWSGDVAPGDVDRLFRTLVGAESRRPLSSAAS
ncbi:hypothetical protein LWC35_17105 [Pseudonocardia kujensis]|uniref:hypothetical protein n=1 Tax=Pseudonocardia kujensis TaxID=1128675 RepID=UPI001E4089C6|nr:hypothetical protein [Pseudonocardia kujensis]MCE0764615.1 hypothetical protein [Pseudonocardia kujensis]